jgi:Tfp pilus assembly protein PilP
MPYKFMGKMDDASSLKAFLNRGDRVYVVSVGEVVDNTYRIDSIKAGQMTMTYLPLNVSQTLSVGSPL